MEMIRAIPAPRVGVGWPFSWCPRSPGSSCTAWFAIAFELAKALERHGVDADADSVNDALQTLAQRLTERLRDSTIERMYEATTISQWAAGIRADRAQRAGRPPLPERRVAVASVTHTPLALPRPKPRPRRRWLFWRAA